ncbi:unnamed protein product [Caenorhabditis brenneri]
MRKIFYFILSFFSSRLSHSSPEEDAICEKERQRWGNCTWFEGGKSEEPSFNQPALVDLKKTVACIRNITCKGSKKLVKFHFDTLVFSMEQLEGDKIQCVRKTGQATQLRQCILDIWPFIHAKQYNGEIIHCTSNIMRNLKCGSEEKRAIMKAAWAQDYNMRTKLATWNETDGVDNFDEIFDPEDFS